MEKNQLNCDKIWKVWKKSQLNSEKIWKIWDKGKSNSEKEGKRGGGGLFGCNYD